MIFLYPQFLFALFALAIPIIIHLFNFRKTKKIYFSNSQLLKNVKEASSAKRKLKHYLILASRLLFIGFLVLAFAQPFIPVAENRGTYNSVIIYLDNSFSTSNQVQSEANALALGINYVNEIVDLYPENTQYIFLNNDFEPSANFFKTAEQVKENSTEIQYSGVTRSFNEIVAKIDQINQGNTAEVYFISDFQKSTYGSLNEMNKDTALMYNMVPLQYSTYSNIFVDSTFLSKPLLQNGQDNQLEVLLSNTGQEAVSDLIATLHVNNVQVASASVDIPPEGRGQITFPLNFNLLDYNECTIEFEDFPITFDNEFYFSLNKADPVTVMEIKDTQATTHVQYVFANESLFNFSSFGVGGIDYSQISRSDLVILNELAEVSASLSSALNDYLSQGGNVLYIPSESSTASAMDFFPKNASVSRTEGASKNELAAPDFSNPFFEYVFEEKNTGIDMPQATNLVTWRNATDNILVFKNGSPYLSVFSNQGKFYILGSPLQDDFTNFHQHALFVPIMYRMASLSKTGTEKLYYGLDQSLISVGLDTVAANYIYKLHGPDQEIIPDQRITGNELLLDIPKDILEAGHYSLILDADTLKKMAFNINRKESVLDQHQGDELVQSFSSHEDVKILDVENVSNFNDEIKENNFGKPLWKYAIIIALLCLFTEVLFLRFL